MRRIANFRHKLLVALDAAQLPGELYVQVSWGKDPVVWVRSRRGTGRAGPLYLDARLPASLDVRHLMRRALEVLTEGLDDPGLPERFRAGDRELAAILAKWLSGGETACTA